MLITSLQDIHQLLGEIRIISGSLNHLYERPGKYLRAYKWQTIKLVLIVIKRGETGCNNHFHVHHKDP